MPGTSEGFSVESPAGDRNYHYMEQTLTGVSSIDPLRCTGEVVVQLTGSATAVTAIVERSFRDPNSSPNWAPAGDIISGNPSAGLNVKRYAEPTRGWWRVRVIAITGANVLVHVSSEKA